MATSKPEPAPSLPPVFISHDAAGDAPLVQAFVDLLELGVGIKHAQVFCTSEKGQGAAIGHAFTSDIRDHLRAAKVVVAVLTENFWASPFCVGELGACWYDSAKVFLPVLVPPLGYDDLRGVVTKTEALVMNRPEDLDRLRDAIVSALEMSDSAVAPTPKWNNRKDAFLKALPELSRRCPARSPVPRDKVARLEKDLAEYRKAYDKVVEESDLLKQQVRDLRAAKDKRAVAAIAAKYSSTGEQFEALVSAAAKALSPLPRVVREALYFRTRGDDYDPDRDDWDAVRNAEQNGYLDVPDGAPQVRMTNKKIRAAVEAIDAVEKWLEAPPEDFPEWYERKFNGEESDIMLRPFWDRHMFD